LNIFGHDGDTLGMDGAEVGVLEESDEISFGRFLKGGDGVALETDFGLEILGDLTD